MKRILKCECCNDHVDRLYVDENVELCERCLVEELRNTDRINVEVIDEE